MREANQFSKISSIDTCDEGSWKNKVFLTFDIDWAADEVIEDVLLLCDPFDVEITFYATHQSGIINQMSFNKKYEIGLHPNFNPLLSGDENGQETNFRSIVDQLKCFFPKATSVKSHSLCFGSLIQTAYKDFGISHDSSVIIPYQNNSQALFPWKMWDGLVRVPYLFCDYVTSMTSDAKIPHLVNRSGLKVFDFHPIHVFLNTESIERYERTRPLHHKPKELINHRFTGYGTRDRLLELLELAKH